VNVKEYISSGIIESYVLGLATEAERLEFEAACRNYPEVRQARLQFEKELEQQLLEEAPVLPAELKKKIDARIKELEAPESAASIDHERPVRRMNIWKVAAAASVAALIGVLAWAISLNTKNKTLQDQNATLRQSSAAVTAQLNQMREDAQRMQTPTVKMAAMQGTPSAPGAWATVYWDTTSTDVYMMINNLPQPASDKQYQLWALINNKPEDLGVFEVKQQKLLVKMRNVRNAQVFAVTLEPRGGSPTPTGAMYVMGKL
jgi:anti-sigma-K factor RskA